MRGLAAQVIGPLALALARPFVTARGRVGARHAALLRVDDGAHFGAGEATPLEGFSPETAREAREALGAIARRLDGLAPPDTADEVAALTRRVAAWAPPTARFATELALLDLAARRNTTSVARLLDADAARAVPVNATIGAPDPGACADQARAARAQGFTCIKLKVGGRPLDDDLARVAAVREAAGPLTLRLDANGAWGDLDPAYALTRLEPFAVSLLEQPTPTGDLDAMAAWRGRGVLIAADESVRGAADLDAVLARGAADVVVLKPALIGGLLPALAMQRRALDHGVTAIVTTLLDGALGRAGALHLAAACRDLAGPCGLATAGVLAGDLVDAPEAARDGAIALPDAPGLGVDVSHWFDDARPLDEAPCALDAPLMIPHPLVHRARHDAARAAVAWDGGAWTWRELHDEATTYARALAARGVTSGARVGVRARNSAALVALSHAVAMSGAVFVALHPDDPVERAEALAARARCALVVAEDVPGAVPLSTLREEGERAPEVTLAGRVALSSPHALLFTSGTTGAPKMATLTWQNHVFSATGSAIRLGHDPGDRWLAALPMCHIAGLAITLRGAILGVTTVVHDGFDAGRVADAIASGEATLVSLVARMLWGVLDALGERAPHARFRAVLLGGGAIPPELLERCRAQGVRVAPTYGMTEASSQVATGRPGAWEDPERAGAPMIFTEVALGDEPEGEVWVRGPTVSPGYAEVDAAGALRARRPAAGWFATGDWARWSDGELVILDRRTDLIVTGGENVYPAEVESVLRAHPYVAEACVVGLTDAQWGQTVAAALVPTPEAPAEPARTEDVSRWCQEELARFKAPRRISWWEGGLPRTSLQKVKRGEVREAMMRDARS
jgi:O-succinylbenzoic acid--CoA ligase